MKNAPVRGVLQILGSVRLLFSAPKTFSLFLRSLALDLPMIEAAGVSCSTGRTSGAFCTSPARMSDVLSRFRFACARLFALSLHAVRSPNKEPWRFSIACSRLRTDSSSTASGRLVVGRLGSLTGLAVSMPAFDSGVCEDGWCSSPCFSGDKTGVVSASRSAGVVLATGVALGSSGAAGTASAGDS